MSYTEMEEDLHLMGSFEDETALGEHCATQQQHKNAAKLQAVHQAYRKMEKIKRYYHIDTEGSMRRQQALLDNLKSDNDALQEMVDTYVIKDYRQQMAHLLEEANKYTGLVEAETKRLHDLEATICSLGIQELDSKKIMGGYKAGWTKHRTTQIHIQQDENRLQKANVDNNIVQGHIKLLKGKMSQLRQEQAFYTNLYQKLNKELQEWDQDIQQCIVNMNGMYSDRNEYQEEISDLLEMAGCKHNYFQWLTMEGWATQESFSLTELASSQLSGTENDNIEDDLKKHGLQDTRKEIDINKLRKTKDQNMRKITKTHYAKRRKAGNHYRKWVEIKAFANTQDLLKVDSISGVLPSILETQNKNAELFKHMNELLKEMDGLDMVKQDHIFGKPAPENGDSKSSVAARKYETDQTVDYLLDSLRHLEIDDEAFVPVVIDMKKQILLVFKEAGCYIKDEALGIGSDPGHEKCYKKSPDNQPLELTVGKFFSKLEDFVDRISGTFS